jgi:Tol biopolymer transport system component
MYAHLQEPPPQVTADRPELSREIDAVVARAMSKAPDDRQSSAGALLREAADALDVGASSPPATDPRSRVRRLAGVLAVALAIVGAVVVTSLVQDDTPQTVAGPTSGASPTASPRPTAAPAFPTVRRPLEGEEQRLLASVPPDASKGCLPLDRPAGTQGELAALVCDTGDVEVLYELFPTQDAMNAAFQINVNNKQAPPGDCAAEHLAVESYTVEGRRAGRVLCYTITRVGALIDPRDTTEQSRIEWTDENALIYAQAVRNDLSDLSLYGWWLTSAGPVPPGGGAVPAKDSSTPLATARVRDGSYLVTPAASCAGFKGATCALHIDGTSYRNAVVGHADPSEIGTLLLEKPNRVVFSPESGFCFETGDDIRPAVYAVNGASGGLMFRRVRGGECAGPQKLAPRGVVWTPAPSGTIALEQQGEIALMDPGGFAHEQIAPDTQTRRKDPDWSSDGSRIVFASTRAQEDDDLYVMRADGSDRTQLTHVAGDEYDPAWSPDGSKIVFGYDNLGLEAFTNRIDTIDANGGNVTQLVTRVNERLGWPQWSPDGRQIAFSGYAQSGWKLYVMDADGADLRVVHREPRNLYAVPLTWTPDGTHIVFWGEEGGREQLLSMRPDGTDVRPFLDADLPGPLTIDWSPDDDWIIASGVFDQAAVGQGAPPVLLIRSDGSQVFEVFPTGSEPSWRPEGS